MYTVSGTIFQHFKIEVPDLQVPADLLTFTKELLKENITFNELRLKIKSQFQIPYFQQILTLCILFCYHLP